MRIVSLCPSNTEILACLGLTAQLIGVDHYSDWPADVKKLPNLGPDLNINIEKVIELKPDFIVGSLSVPGMEKVVERVKSLNTPFLILDPHRLGDIFNDIIKVGEATDRYQKACDLVDWMKERIEEIRQKCPKANPPLRLYWEWWPKPVVSPGGKNWLTDLSEIVGATNVFADIPEDNVKSDWAGVIQANPDYTMVVWTGIPLKNVKIEKIINRPEWRGYPFAKRDRIHILEEGWFCRPSPRLITGLEHLAHILYPEIFPEAKSFI